MPELTGPIEARQSKSLLLYIRTANRNEFDAFAEAAWAQASERLRRAITLEELKGRLQKHHVILVVTDCLFRLLGGLALDTTDIAKPRLCWAWLDESVRGLGLGRDMARLLISNHMVSEAPAGTIVGSYTSERHLEAERSLEAMKFASRDLVCSHAAANDGGATTTERPVKEWWMDYAQLTELLEEAKRLPPVARRAMAGAQGLATVELNHPVTRDPLMRMALDRVVRERQRPGEDC